MILGPGIHDGISAADYHADPCEKPSLSSSIAKLLLDRTPRHAWAAHPRLNPRSQAEDNDRFDLGSVAHELILGRGGGFEIVHAENWLTKGARQDREESRARGKTPILAAQLAQARDMSLAVWERLSRIDPCVSATSGFKSGAGERVVIWRESGCDCRCMIDWHGPTPIGVWDLKTTSVPLSDDALSRLIVNLGYDMKAAFYLRGLGAALPEYAGAFRWKWIFCESSPPHEVRVIEPSGEMLEIGARKADMALQIWRGCMTAGVWPGYSARVTRLDPPAFASERWLAREVAMDAAE